MTAWLHSSPRCWISTRHLSQAKTDQEKRLITQEIESTDRQIDSLVYGLYGLTADEIAVVGRIRAQIIISDDKKRRFQVSGWQIIPIMA